jgi:hypothetical protein
MKWLVLLAVIFCSEGKTVTISNVDYRLNVTGDIMDAHDGTYNQWTPGVTVLRFLWLYLLQRVVISGVTVFRRAVVLLRNGVWYLQTRARYVSFTLWVWLFMDRGVEVSRYEQ